MRVTGSKDYEAAAEREYLEWKRRQLLEFNHEQPAEPEVRPSVSRNPVRCPRCRNWATVKARARGKCQDCNTVLTDAPLLTK